MAKDRINLDYADEGGRAVMRTPGGDALPQPLDPVVTMDLVQRYVETERVRTRRALLWTGMVFLFVILAVLAMFVSVGIFVLRQARKTSQTVAKVQNQAAVYATEVVGMNHKLNTLEEGQSEVSTAIKTADAERARSKAVLESDLSRFSRWVSSSRDKEGRMLAAMEARLLDLEKKLATRDKEIEELREQTGTAPSAASASREAFSRRGVPRAMQRPDAEVAGGTQPIQAPSGDLAALLDSYPGQGSGMVGEILLSAGVAKSEEAFKRPQEEPQSAETVSITFPNGDQYQGQFKDGLLHGSGAYAYSNGDRYEGEFRRDMRDGKGTMYYSNGNKYIGTFRENERHGKGRFIFANGDVYEGDFVHDVRSGKGTYLFSNGARYIGEFKDGRMHGKGRYIYAGGEEYVGQFSDGKKHGEGICIYQNGREIKVLWENDRFIRTLKN
jgi:cell division protein FtsB